jgi:hypothetical protein
MSTALLGAVAGLMRLRAGPQDLPHSPTLLAGLLVASVALDQVAAQQLGGASGGLALRIGLVIVVGLALPYLILHVARRTARFVQTASAIIATGLCFALLALPIVAMVGKLPEDPAEITSGQMLFGWLSLALLVWKLVVQGSIFRHALDVPLRQGVLLAVALMLFELAVGVVLVAARSA